MHISVLFKIFFWIDIYFHIVVHQFSLHSKLTVILLVFLDIILILKTYSVLGLASYGLFLVLQLCSSRTFLGLPHYVLYHIYGCSELLIWWSIPRLVLEVLLQMPHLTFWLLVWDERVSIFCVYSIVEAFFDKEYHM